MHGKMTAKFIGAGESLWAVRPRTGVRFLPSVRPHVGLEVVRTRESSLAHVAFEGADTSVLAGMASELVGSAEALSTALDLTGIGLLSSVLADVHLEVGELHVALGATRVQTHKGFASLLVQFCLFGGKIVDGWHHVGHHWLNVGGRGGEKRDTTIVHRGGDIAESNMLLAVLRNWGVHVAGHHSFFCRGRRRERSVGHRLGDDVHLRCSFVRGIHNGAAVEFGLHWGVLLRGPWWRVGEFVIGCWWTVVDGWVGRGLGRVNFLLQTESHVSDAFFHYVSDGTVGGYCNGRKTEKGR